MLCFVVFKRRTAYEVRISDWSSYVCSSDLARPADGRGPRGSSRRARRTSARAGASAAPPSPAAPAGAPDPGPRVAAGSWRSATAPADRAGRAPGGRARPDRGPSCGGDRKTVGSGKSVQLRVDLGGCVDLQKTNKI